MAKSTSTRNSNTWETGTCKRPEQEATPPSERVGPRAKGSPRAAVNSSDTKYKLINTRRGRAYGSRARAEGMDMILKKGDGCLFIIKLSPLGSKQQASTMMCVAVSFLPPTHYLFIYRTTSRSRPVVPRGGATLGRLLLGVRLEHGGDHLGVLARV